MTDSEGDAIMKWALASIPSLFVIWWAFDAVILVARDVWIIAILQTAAIAGLVWHYHAKVNDVAGADTDATAGSESVEAVVD